MAAEGEDPCHAGSAPDAPETADMDNMQDMDSAYAYDPQQDKQALMQDMLRGVIMSEILTRPCDRMATKRTNRRSAV